MASEPDLLAGVPAAEWDALAGNRFYSSSAWLTVCARAAGGPATAAVVRADDGAAVAAVPVRRLAGARAANYDWNLQLGRHELPGIPPDGLLVGPSLGYQAHLLAGPEQADDPATTAALVEKVRRLARSGSGVNGSPGEESVVAMYLSTPDVRRLRAAGVTAPPVLLEPEAYFEVPAGGWQPWLAAQRGSCRRRIGRDVRRFEAAGYDVRRADLADCYLELPRVAIEIAKKFGHAPDEARFGRDFRGYVDAGGDRFQVVLAHDAGGDLIGFCIYVVQNDLIYLRWSAFDYPRLVERQAEYVNLCYYAQLRLAGEVGAREIEAGKNALTGKVLRGARLRPLWLVDLTAGSPLAGHERAVREQNARLLRELQDNDVTRHSVADPDDWLEFALPGGS